MLFSRKKYFKIVSFLMSSTLVLSSIGFTINPTYADETGVRIINVSTDKARYSPGEKVNISVNLENVTNSDVVNGTVDLSINRLEKLVDNSLSETYSLGAGESKTLTFTWTAPKTDYQGYLVDVDCKNSAGNSIDSTTEGVDVSSDWLKFPRYGYVTKYGNNVDTANVISQLNDYHINSLQFYDWQYEHHVPVKGDPSNPDASWKDIANRDVYKNTINNYISNAHNTNMVAMNYNLIYGATDNYATDGSGISKDWGLFDSPGGSQWKMSMPAGWSTSAIYMFNPLNTNWQNYIYNREADVFKAFNFDGWHADTIGDWGTKYDSKGNPVSITTTFQTFLNNAKAALGNKYLVMNPVGNKGHYGVNTSKDDAIYTEIWPNDGYPDYNSLRNVIDTARIESGGKSLIVPAYMNYDYGNTKSDENPGTFNTPGVLLTDASVFAAGGSRIEIGDDSRMLSNEYFPNEHLNMTDELKTKEKNYYNFLVSYENLLRDGQNNTQNEVKLPGYASSDSGQANKVWTFTKKDDNYEIIHMINLLGEKDTTWRDTNANKPAPNKITNVPVKYYYSGHVGSVWLASPDANSGKSTNLSFKLGSDEDGNYVTFTVPSLQYWDMVYISKSDITPPGTVANGSFETGDTTNWTMTGTSYGVDSSDQHSGSYKLWFWSNSPFTEKAEQTVTGVANGTYNVTAWVKQNTGTPDICQMQLSDYGGSILNTDIAHSTTYKQITSTVNVTSGKITIAFYEKGSGAEENLQIDDVQITKVGASDNDGNNTNEITVPNGGFDTGDLTNWITSGNNLGVDGSDVHSGGGKCWFYGGSPFKQKIDQTISLANGNYTVSAWVKQNTGTPNIAQMQLSGFGGTSVNTDISHGDTYQQISANVTVVNGKLNIAFFEDAPANTNLEIDDVQVMKAQVNSGAELQYEGHVQNYGWGYNSASGWQKNLTNTINDPSVLDVSNDKLASTYQIVGTTGEALRLEALKLNLTGAVPKGASIQYRVYVQNLGWTTAAADGTQAGTTGQDKRIEAAALKLIGLPGYQLQYKAHVENRGWDANWTTVKDSDTLGTVNSLAPSSYVGTTGKGLRLEALAIRLVKVN